MYKYELPIFVWEIRFSDVIKYVHNIQSDACFRSQQCQCNVCGE